MVLSKLFGSGSSKVERISGAEDANKEQRANAVPLPASQIQPGSPVHAAYQSGGQAATALQYTPVAETMGPGQNASGARPPAGPPALGRASMNAYLCREEVCAEGVARLQQGVSRRLARASANPAVQNAAKATLRREAAEVHLLHTVPSDDLLPQLESVLSFEREGREQTGGGGNH